MFKALVVKELRETAWIALLALAAHLYYATVQMGVALLPWQAAGSRREIPFLSGSAYFLGGSYLSEFTLVSLCLAIALGYRQSLGESLRGTWPFLLHQPIDRRRVIGAKLLVGAVLCLVVSAVPIVLYGWWAVTPGTHASPFFWSMTLPTWTAWILMPLVYLGAFLSGIRPARWAGTRLLPLVAVAAAVLLLANIPWWLVLGAAPAVVLCVLLVANILFVSRTRDFS